MRSVLISPRQKDESKFEESTGDFLIGGLIVLAIWGGLVASTEERMVKAFLPEVTHPVVPRSQAGNVDNYEVPQAK